MSFVHPLLLGGLLLVGIPVLLHLIMRQKPKHLLFPAMRFLLERHRSNQRKLHLRHLLLLALRILLIAALVLALARPKIFSQRLNLAGNRPIAAVLLFDTSYSMEYTLGDRTRLDEARRRAFELLDDLPDNSRVAVLDTAEGGGEWLPSLSLVRDRITGLKLRPSNYPVTSQLPHAYDLLAQALQEQAGAEDAPLPFLYIFSDRTQGCWEANQLENLQHLRDQRLPSEVHGVFVDVGVDQPTDLGILRVEV
ncbi:MAG: BatA and WFA domain-containing protein, partial [Planctomycetes bacterium]|nr:BatA and WFA domain-containing protein [Planctomycetota bacterium]